MIHLALVNNLLAALGAPRLGRHNLPQRSPYAPEIRLTLAPFSGQTMQRFLYIERPEGMDISSIAGELDHDRPAPPVPTGPQVVPAPRAFSSIRELYRGIERGLRGLVDRYGEERVFVGSPNAQASTRYFTRPRADAGADPGDRAGLGGPGHPDHRRRGRGREAPVGTGRGRGSPASSRSWRPTGR